MDIPQLISQYPIISEQIETRELTTILQELQKSLLAVDGDIVEMGCYVGTTSLFIQRLLVKSHENRTFHVYDSFAGLPEKTSADTSPAGEQFVSGELYAQKSQFVRNFRQANLPLPRIHKGWFADLTEADMPDRIAFAFLDGDYYESIRDSLQLIEKRLSPNAIIVVDDYQSEALPGARKAVDEWLKHRPSAQLRTAHSLAIIKQNS